jgi:uncharacterized membrane protein YkoI
MMRVLLVVLGLMFGAWTGPGTGPAAVAAPLRQLTQADVMPLGSVLEAIAQRFPGRALDARLSRAEGDAIYRIKWLGEDGRARDITVDARTGQIRQVR